MFSFKQESAPHYLTFIETNNLSEIFAGRNFCIVAERGVTVQN